MAQNAEFKYAPIFQMGDDTTEYKLITKDFVCAGDFEGHQVLKVTQKALMTLIETAFTEINFKLRRSHNEQIAKIFADPEASENDKYVVLAFLRNGEISAKGILPDCQDTGR